MGKLKENKTTREKAEKIEIRNLKGVYDYSTAEMGLRNRITDTLRRNFELFGYSPLETAMLNYKEILTYKYGDDAEIVREIYRLNDQGERDLGLRFDLTVPLCKYIALNRSLKMPFKRYEFGKVFRNGPVKSGRNREFIQCDVDIVGDAGRTIEAELIQLAVQCYIDLGIIPLIKIGNRKLLCAMIKYAGADKNLDEIIGIIDKIEKVDKEETKKALTKYMDNVQAETLMEIIGYGISDLEKILKDNDGITEIKELFEKIDELKISNSVIFCPSLARGLNVYTGTVFEVFDRTGRYTSSLGGGGRYDNIITNFIRNGQQYPAVGISFGLEPISAVLTEAANNSQGGNSQGGSSAGDSQTGNSAGNSIAVFNAAADLLVIPINAYKNANNFAAELRNKNIKVMLWTANEKVGKALEYANATGIKFAAVIGDDEIKSNTVQIKNMKTGKQTPCCLKSTTDIAKLIHGQINAGVFNNN
jgi:histidyl-tRNA synthetase